jgi:hypothetical protein
MDDWDPAVINAIAAERPVILFDNAQVGLSTRETPDAVKGMADKAVVTLLRRKTSMRAGRPFERCSGISKSMELQRKRGGTRPQRECRKEHSRSETPPSCRRNPRPIEGAGGTSVFHGSLAGLLVFAPRSFPIFARAIGVNTMHAAGCLGAAIGSSLMGAVMLGCGFAG